MADDRDRPDPSLPLTNDSIDLDLDDLTPAQAVNLIEREAAKLIDPRFDIDRESWQIVKLRGKRHMTPREFEANRISDEARRRMQERNDRAALERIRAAHPDWLSEPPPE